MSVKKIIKTSFSTLLTWPQSHAENHSSPAKGWEIQCEDAEPRALGVPVTTWEISEEFFTSSESWLAYLKMGIPTEQGR